MKGGSTVADADGGTVSITVAAGEAAQCTFVNQQRSTVCVRVYHDRNGNGTRDDEPTLAGWSTVLYDGQGNVIATGETNGWGTREFPGLRPGPYTVCVVLLAGWFNRQPGLLDPAFGNQPCYGMTIRPAQRWTAWFGQVDDALLAAGVALTPDGLTVEELVDSADEADYAVDVTISAPVGGEIGDQQLFLPVVIQ